MMYLLAILLPPLAMLMVGRPMEAVICLILQLTVFGWLPAAIWACFMVNSHQTEKRLERMVKESQKTKSSRWED